ncbi:NRCAM [Mytilus edulis]|uniref:NRCAM n=1 Tax=Mytilus edulis TaxID=6550 RepID=A0A8S3RLH7_MYTED|nr:NRCAM [Mytilus edulis]
MVQLFDSGTIIFIRPEAKDEGIFQCNAINEHGTSTTINVNLREAMLGAFPSGEDTVRQIAVGHSVKLPCIPPTSVPKAEIRWVLKDTKTGKIEAINLNNRMTMDLEGNLYITAFQQSDFQNGRSYVCMAINNFVRQTTSAPGIVLQPAESFSTDDTIPLSLLVEATLGNLCPTPEIHWESNTGTIPDSRRTMSQGGQELRITSQREDCGQYICFTTSQQIIEEKDFIYSKPYWTGGEPKDIETSIGASATFYCNASGDPQPELEWYINGVRLKGIHKLVKSSSK